MKLSQYFRIWLASIRYSLVRTMMFRFDTLLWAAVELAWMGVNILLVEVIYLHTEEVAGWSKFEMVLLVGTAMLIQRLLMGFFWTNLFEIGRNVRTGYFDFFLAQPGNPLFMVSTRKIDPDGIANTFVAGAVVAGAVYKLGLRPDAIDVAAYVFMLGCGLMIHYSVFLLVASTTFWIIKTEGIEGSYFTIFEFARLPRSAFKNLILKTLFVWTLPAVIVSNVPAQTLINGLTPALFVWLGAATLGWFCLAVFVFHRGLRRYASASS
jgi:ABC-2 type transport system permease protein